MQRTEAVQRISQLEAAVDEAKAKAPTLRKEQQVLLDDVRDLGDMIDAKDRAQHDL